MRLCKLWRFENSTKLEITFSYLLNFEMRALTLSVHWEKTEDYIREYYVLAMEYCVSKNVNIAVNCPIALLISMFTFYQLIRIRHYCIESSYINIYIYIFFGEVEVFMYAVSNLFLSKWIHIRYRKWETTLVIIEGGRELRRK